MKIGCKVKLSSTDKLDLLPLLQFRKSQLKDCPACEDRLEDGVNTDKLPGFSTSVAVWEIAPEK